MPSLRKLKVILQEKYKDPVLLFVSKEEAVQFYKVDCEAESNAGFLQACATPDEKVSRNTEIQTRIKSKLNELDLEYEDRSDSVELFPGNTINDILSKIEIKLKEIEEESIPIVQQVLKMQDQEESKKRILKKIPNLSDIHSNLLNLHAMTLEIEILLETETSMAHCDTIVYFEAWVLKKKLKKITEGIDEITSGSCVVKAEKDKSDDVPRYIKRKPKLFEGFEILTYSLGFPRKREINPTYLMAVTFPFLFGIMFADVGHGLILFFGGILLFIARKRTDVKKVGEIPKYLLLASGIITLCGISSIAWGFLFGEFFGPSGVLHPILLLKFGPFRIGGFDPAHEPLVMLRFTILIGVSFITLSLIMRTLNHIRRLEMARALASLCWIWFLIGGLFMWVYWGGISQITRWFGEGMPMLLGLVIAPLIVAMLLMGKAEGMMEGVNFSVEVFIESLGHTLSFCRLAALFLAHTALSSMFLELGGVEDGYFPPAAIGLVAIGTVLILFIEGLIVMVHCLRLHWIELLPKYYSAKGTPFIPLKIK